MSEEIQVCPTCNGSGTITTFGSKSWHEEICEFCGGTGIDRDGTNTIVSGVWDEIINLSGKDIKRWKQEMAHAEELTELKKFRDYLADLWERYLNREEERKDLDFNFYILYWMPKPLNTEMCKAAYEMQQKEKEKD